MSNNDKKQALIEKLDNKLAEMKQWKYHHSSHTVPEQLAELRQKMDMTWDLISDLEQQYVERTNYPPRDEIPDFDMPDSPPPPRLAVRPRLARAAGATVNNSISPGAWGAVFTPEPLETANIVDNSDDFLNTTVRFETEGPR